MHKPAAMEQQLADRMMNTSDALVRSLGRRFPRSPRAGAAALAVALGRIAATCDLDVDALCSVARDTADAVADERGAQ